MSFGCLAANAKLAASLDDALVFVEACHARMSVAVWDARMQAIVISLSNLANKITFQSKLCIARGNHKTSFKKAFNEVV